MPLPNFLVIGSAKSGTTSLHGYLNQHPEVFMSVVKEPKFFEFEGHDLTFGNPNDADRLRAGGVVTSIEAYRALFDGVTVEKAIGEASTSYLQCTRAPERICHYIPDARLIAILRNPVDRAYSNYLQLRRQGREKEANFLHALRQEDARLAHGWSSIWAVRDRGLYFQQLSRFSEYFDLGQVKVCLYEDLQKAPLALCSELFEFLGVDSGFAPRVDQARNRGGIPRNMVGGTAMTLYYKHERIFRSMIPARVRSALRAHALDRPPPIPEDARDYLAALYREDILRLEALIDRDLSHWLEAGTHSAEAPVA